MDAHIQSIAERVHGADADHVHSELERLVDENHRIHQLDCVNLNPATNTMNPRAEAVLASGVGVRPSLGYPSAKYEMGLEAIEQIEVIAAELVAEVFHADYAEIRVASGAMANLYAFMACTQPGDAIIVVPPTIGGHVTHHRAGAAGLYGLDIHDAPIDADAYTVDVAALAELAERVRPKLLTIGGSLNLTHHDVAGIRAVADSVGARVLFDAAHLSGLIAGNVWPDPLAAGAHVMTMSTYKSLAGPPSGLLVTNDAAVAERVDAIAFPGLTANFDVAKSAALAITMLDWLALGHQYAQEMVATSTRLAEALVGLGVDVHRSTGGITRSHAFALSASGGGHQCAQHLREANILSSAIGLPAGTDAGVRLGTNELVRWGAASEHMDELAFLVDRALKADVPAQVAADVSAFRRRFDTLHYVRP